MTNRVRNPRHPALSILETIRDPQLFGPLFKGMTWLAWRAFLATIFGLPMPEASAALVRRCTGRQALPTKPAKEAWVIVGRRGGKSRIAALLAVFLACFRDYRKILVQGERGTIMLIASDRKQARVLKGYVAGLLHAVPMLEAMIVNETAESIELSHHVVIEVHTASFRSVRGYTIIAAILDEVAFWPTDEAANPDSEIIKALRPAMLTVPGALLIAISSPYARRGELWKAHREHFGKDDDPILVWQAATRTMNPAVPEKEIKAEYDKDPASAEAEYGAQFRRDIEAFISPEVLEAAKVPGRYELPLVPKVRYMAFVDPSGGSADSMTLAIAHSEGERAILDAVREVQAPFSPETVVEEFAELLKAYGVSKVTGDRYAGEWPRERFRKHGISYELAEKAKSDLYQAFLPLLNSRQLDLLDHQRLFTQLARLERRTGRSGRDTIDHPPGTLDDLANAGAGAVVLARPGRRKCEIWMPGVESPLDSLPYNDSHQVFRRLGMALPLPASEPLTCESCGNFEEESGRCSERNFTTQGSFRACELYLVRPPKDAPADAAEPVPETQT